MSLAFPEMTWGTTRGDRRRGNGKGHCGGPGGPGDIEDGKHGRGSSETRRIRAILLTVKLRLWRIWQHGQELSPQHGRYPPWKGYSYSAVGSSEDGRANHTGPGSSDGRIDTYTARAALPLQGAPGRYATTRVQRLDPRLV